MLFSPFALRQAVAGQYARGRDPASVHLLHHMCQAASDLNVTTTDVTEGFLTELMPLLKEDRAAAVETILEVGEFWELWDPILSARRRDHALTKSLFLQLFYARIVSNG